MKAGDAFYLQDRTVDTHLWVVISDPEKDVERVVIVSVTTYASHKEDVCLLDVADHPRVGHKSCVAYNADFRGGKLTDIFRDPGHPCCDYR